MTSKYLGDKVGEMVYFIGPTSVGERDQLSSHAELCACLQCLLAQPVPFLKKVF